MAKKGKNPFAVGLAKLRAASLSSEERSAIASKAGKAGGKARAKKMSKAERSESARQAAAARWGKK